GPFTGVAPDRQVVHGLPNHAARHVTRVTGDGDQLFAMRWPTEGGRSLSAKLGKRGYAIRDTRYGMRDAGCWMLDTRYEMRDGRSPSLRAGNRMISFPNPHRYPVSSI